MADIELNRDTIQFLIEKAHEFHTREDVEFDEEPDIANDDWSSQMLCPTNPEHLATGLVVHLHAFREEIVGLQLICRRIGTR